MRMKAAAAQQLKLPVIGQAKLPFAIRSRAVRRAAKNRVAAYAANTEALARGAGFALSALAHDEALLDQMRRRVGAKGRRCGLRVASFAATLDGRRVHRLMDELSARIAAAEETLLCA